MKAAALAVTSALNLHAKSKGENVKVVVRCRPLNGVEKERGDDTIVIMDTKLGSIRVNNPATESEFKTFTFDSVYPPGTDQKVIFNDCTKPIIDSVLNGYNGTLFCYGQTGTGKTFTMEGVVDDEALRGMVPQAFYYVFDGVKSNHGENMEFLVRGSFLEIYKDDVYDLLNSKMRSKMEVKESTEKGVFVKDLSTFTVKSADDLLKILKVGQKQRKVGATKMNEGSSRSHSILTITIESSEKVKDKEGNETVHYKVGKLNMVDLAGSERQKKTEASGDRLEEAKSINWSLTVLGNCIKALVEPNSKHVPYRDSKLTRLLQDSLGGNTKTVMCANLGPASPNYDETLSTLRYADRAKQIKNKPVINEDPKDTKLREMQDEIAQLKAMLEARKKGGAGAAGMVGVDFSSSSSTHPASSEGEHMYGMEQIDGDNVIEEIVEKEQIVDTGIKQSDLDEIRKLSEAEHKKILEQYIAANKNEEEARKMAEESAERYEKDLRRKAEILNKESQALHAMETKLREKEDALQKGCQALDDAQRMKSALQRTDAELQSRRNEQEKAFVAMQQAEEDRALTVEYYNSNTEELRMKTQKLKKLWSMYQDKKAVINEVQNEFDVERQDLLDTIRSLDRQIKLKNLIMEEFIPEYYSQLIESHSVYDSVNDAWMIEGVEYAGNNVQREEMMFGGGNGGGMGGGLGSSLTNPLGGSSNNQQRRMFKRGGMESMQQHYNPMGQQQPHYIQQQNQPQQVSAQHVPPSQARFFSYAEFTQNASSSSSGGGEDGKSEEKASKQKKKKNKS